MDSLSSVPKALAFQPYQRLSHTQNKPQRAPIIFLLVLSLSCLYFLTSNSIDFIWVFAFFAALVIGLTLALPQLSSARFFLNKSYPVQVCVRNSDPKNPAPHVVWSIGSNPKWQKSGLSGYRVKGFISGDVYEGEVHRGKCSGSGVYQYYMCGTYEGDWVDGKYDGYGVETWAKGSRYRGQYRNGLRHGLGCLGFILVMFMKGSGLMGNPMVVGFILLRMDASMLGNSSGVLSMDLGITITEMEMYMPVNILQTRCTVLESINLLTAISMRDPGMKAKGKALVCILSEMEKSNPVIGKMGP